MVKPPVLVALTRFSVMERQFLVSLVCCRYVDPLLLIPSLHLQLSLPLYSISVMYLCSTLHFVSEVVIEVVLRQTKGEFLFLLKGIRRPWQKQKVTGELVR